MVLYRLFSGEYGSGLARTMHGFLVLALIDFADLLIRHIRCELGRVTKLNMKHTMIIFHERSMIQAVMDQYKRLQKMQNTKTARFNISMLKNSSITMSKANKVHIPSMHMY